RDRQCPAVAVRVTRRGRAAVRSARARTDPRWRQPLLEIVGFWTADYIARKLDCLGMAGIETLILAIDEDRRCADGALPTAFASSGIVGESIRSSSSTFCGSSPSEQAGHHSNSKSPTR